MFVSPIVLDRRFYGCCHPFFIYFTNKLENISTKSKLDVQNMNFDQYYIYTIHI